MRSTYLVACRASSSSSSPLRLLISVITFSVAAAQSNLPAFALNTGSVQVVLGHIAARVASSHFSTFSIWIHYLFDAMAIKKAMVSCQSGT